ncbi:MAG: SMC-Scp complex subunit ScpB [Bacillales bacterium]|jgi:segregation and condensation protein B|nr:SMC-Scp complex subunit ScpB [Bacillales bacterium]
MEDIRLNVIEWKAAIEGALFLTGDEGLHLNQLAKMLETEEDTVLCLLEELIEEYNKDNRGLIIVRNDKFYRLTTKKDHAEYYSKLFFSNSNSALSQASLETLAIIAYNQPITRLEIEQIRGVKTDRPIYTLMSRLLIKEIGRSEGAGRAILYGTTKEFLQYFGLQSLEELPPLPTDVTDENLKSEVDLFFDQIREEVSK